MSRILDGVGKCWKVGLFLGPPVVPGCTGWIAEEVWGIFRRKE